MDYEERRNLHIQKRENNEIESYEDWVTMEKCNRCQVEQHETEVMDDGICLTCWREEQKTSS